MRELKIRIWDMDRKVMLGIQYVIFYNGDFYENYRDLEDGIPIENIVVMQSTGLKDKNGVGIYEGDIIKNIRNGISRKVYWDTHCASFHLSKRGREKPGVEYWSLSNPKWNYEVIGNIYENQELLESKKTDRRQAKSVKKIKLYKESITL